MTGPLLKVRLLTFAILAAALSGGCTMPDRNTVWLTRLDSDHEGPARFHWLVRHAVFKADPRGQYELLAESVPQQAEKPIRQWLYVRVMWDISPSRTGTDETALNARAGYLIQTDTGQPGQKTLYYEGTGNVYTDQPRWIGGRRFQIRHVLLRLTRADRDYTIDPFGQVDLEAEITAGVDPEASSEIEKMLRVIDALRTPIIGPAVPPTTAPASGPDLPVSSAPDLPLTSAPDFLPDLLPGPPPQSPRPSTAPESRPTDE